MLYCRIHVSVVLELMLCAEFMFLLCNGAHASVRSSCYYCLMELMLLKGVHVSVVFELMFLCGVHVSIV